MSSNIWISDNPEKCLQGTSYAHEWTTSNTTWKNGISYTGVADYGYKCVRSSNHIRHVDCTDMTSGSLGWWCIGKPALHCITAIQLSQQLFGVSHLYSSSGVVDWNAAWSRLYSFITHHSSWRHSRHIHRRSSLSFRWKWQLHRESSSSSLESTVLLYVLYCFCNGISFQRL